MNLTQFKPMFFWRQSKMKSIEVEKNTKRNYEFKLTYFYLNWTNFETKTFDLNEIFSHHAFFLKIQLLTIIHAFSINLNPFKLTDTHNVLISLRAWKKLHSN